MSEKSAQTCSDSFDLDMSGEMHMRRREMRYSAAYPTGAERRDGEFEVAKCDHKQWGVIGA